MLVQISGSVPSASAVSPPPSSQRKPKITASRKLLLKSLMLAKAKECWEQEHEEREAEKKRYLAERIPALQTRGLSLSALQDLCRDLHAKVELVDEERYDIEAKCLHNTREVRGPGSQDAEPQGPGTPALIAPPAASGHLALPPTYGQPCDRSAFWSSADAAAPPMGCP
ncbi:PREDICTED: troponin I, slow skeletal muscle [Bison bison bison]|uniref:Troponin I, slow skeletal muscle n=1 Tax=Bison bison bison TaxID=43346 RepID=A0A6P3GSG2_BISBB|nr:PREDICTED: troponin I, slow skeletal muscle [Bison bison bison]